MRDNRRVTSSSTDRFDDPSYLSDLPGGWSVGTPDETDAAELAALLRGTRSTGAAGWAPARTTSSWRSPRPARWCARTSCSADGDGVIRGWASAHDRAAGRAAHRDRGPPARRQPGRPVARSSSSGPTRPRPGVGLSGAWTCSRSTAAPSPTTTGSTAGLPRRLHAGTPLAADEPPGDAGEEA